MEPRFASMSIERFRALRRLKIEGLGRINLITGRNNTGKSSVLEALRILASDASPAVILAILRDREEDLGERDESGRPIDATSMFQMSSLFHGFPPVLEGLDPIVLTAQGGKRSLRLSIGVDWFSEEVREGVRRFVPQQPDLFAETEAVPALFIDANGVRRVFRDFPPRYYRGRAYRPDIAEEPRLPCVFVSPYGGEGTATFGPLWDKISLSDLESDVVAALQIIDPGISAVSMVGGEGPRQMRTAIVRSTSFSRPVPLRSFGDGLNRLFGIVLSLVNARDGLLLIDEFDNGMHHTIQFEAWRVIFDLVRRLNVQVFATSHSWETIEAFQKAASQVPDEGVLVRLSRKGEDIIPTMFREDELAVATRDHIEVR